MTEDERARELIAVSHDMQARFVRPIENTNLVEKSAITVKMVEFANIIANYRGCSPGEIIWLRAKVFEIEHVMSVQAAIRIFGETADKENDVAGSKAAFILRSMNLLSHAKTIAKNDSLQLLLTSEIYSLCRFIDKLMSDCKSPNIK